MTISNNDDVIDSRDVIERIEELKSERSDLIHALNEIVLLRRDNELKGMQGTEVDSHKKALDAWLTWDDENGAELRDLEALAEECEGYSDWRHGETLIRESYWHDYVQELLEDCGDIPRNMPGYLVIDWEATARNIAVDYTEVDFGGVTYYIRSC